LGFIPYIAIPYNAKYTIRKVSFPDFICIFAVPVGWSVAIIITASW